MNHCDNICFCYYFWNITSNSRFMNLWLTNLHVN
jgi:hypothetical protein